MKKIKIITSFMLTILFWGCSEILEPEQYGSLSVDQYFIDSNSAAAAMNACYQSLSTEGCYKRSLWLVGDVASDDTYYGEEDLDGLVGRPNNWTMTELWRDHYRGIYRCNVLLNRIEGVTFKESQAGLKNLYIGQAKFIRALLYFNLVRLFGDVPLITKEIMSPEESYLPRDPSNAIYNQIIADAKDAATLLPDQYGNIPNTENISQEKGRATKGAANMLLASVYLTLKDFSSAKEMALAVFSKYSLLSNYGDLFAKPYVGNSNTYPDENTSESIFEVQFGDQNGRGSNMTWLMGPQSWEGTGLRWNRPTDQFNMDANNPVGYNGKGLVQEFETGDKRAIVLYSTTSTTDLNGSTNLPWKFCGKYLVRTKNNNNTPSNYPVFRYAETLLILAEAENELNGPGSAYQYINPLRQRAGLSDFSGLSKDSFREAVYKERRIELCFEAKRWFDLVRTGRMKSVMTSHLGKSIGDHQNIFPIPQAEIDVNPLLTQNSGY